MFTGSSTVFDKAVDAGDIRCFAGRRRV